MAPRKSKSKSKSAGLQGKSLVTYTQGWVDHQEQTTLDAMEVDQQAEAYYQSDGPQHDQIIWHQHDDAAQAFNVLAQGFRHSKSRQLLPGPTNNPPSQKLPQFSYEVVSLHGLQVPLPSYLPPHQPLYSTDFMVHPPAPPIQKPYPLTPPQQKTYAWPLPAVTHPERTLEPLPDLLPLIETPGPLPEELRLSPFPGQVIPRSGTIWPPPPPEKVLTSTQPNKEFEKQLNEQINSEMRMRLDSVLDIGDPTWGFESMLGEGSVDGGL